MHEYDCKELKLQGVSSESTIAKPLYALTPNTCIGFPAPVIVPVTERIESLEYQAPDFRSAEELKAVFGEADREVRATAKAASDSQADLIIALAKVRAILSQRGKEKMRCEAGIKPTWTAYYRWFQKEFKLELTLRAVQYKIAELAGKNRNRKCTECYSTAGQGWTYAIVLQIQRADASASDSA